MTEKLYGLDDIPEGWRLARMTGHLSIRGKFSYGCILQDWNMLMPPQVKVSGWKTPQLALHRAIQKARGEM